MISNMYLLRLSQYTGEPIRGQLFYKINHKSWFHCIQVIISVIAGEVSVSKDIWIIFCSYCYLYFDETGISWLEFFWWLSSRGTARDVNCDLQIEKLRKILKQTRKCFKSDTKIQRRNFYQILCNISKS